MLSLKMKNDDLVVSTNGLTDLVIIGGKQVTSDLVSVRVRTQRNKHAAFQPMNTIDWIELLETLRSGTNAPKFASIAFTKLRLLISETAGVKSVDFSNTAFEIDGNNLFLNGICFEHVCGTMEELEL